MSEKVLIKDVSVLVKILVEIVLLCYLSDKQGLNTSLNHCQAA